MRIEMNCAGGDTVALRAGDSLREVPQSHRKLITPAVRAAFADPKRHFLKVAGRCRFRGLKALLDGLQKRKWWELRLHSNAYEPPGIASFAFHSSGTRTIEISPAESYLRDDREPRAIVEFYDLLHWVHWSVYGGAGGLTPAGGQAAIARFGKKFQGDKIRPSDTWVFGSTGCGDMFVYTKDGHAGMLCHETFHVHLIGTVEATLDWIFDELRAGRNPEFNYNSWLPKQK